MSRLTLLHINIIGVVVALIVAGGLYFTIITGAQEEAKKAEDSFKAVETRANQWQTAKNALEKANKDKADAEAQYAVYDRQYMPAMNYTKDRVTTMMQVFWPNNGRSWPERFRRTLSTYMNQERRRTGVVWLNPEVIALGPYGPDPNSIQYGPVLRYDFPIQVRAASMGSINRHIANWPRIAQAGVPTVSGLQVVGNSPNLIASYSLGLTLIVRDTIPPVDPRVGGGGSGGGGGGGGGQRGGFGGGGGGGGFGSGGPGGGSGGGQGQGGGPSRAGASSGG